MGQNSAIEWTDHTFNPWHGCIKVSPGCEHCYAETLSKRWGHNIWGPAKTTSRRGMSDTYWKQPHTWNKRAEQANRRARVFCASMADVFEDHPQIDDYEWRERLWDVIAQTPNLDWLLLTKRPENIMGMVPTQWLDWLPRNIWIGTSVEDQQRADLRIPHLLSVPAAVRFLSCEPLLGPLDLTMIPDALYEAGMPFSWNRLGDGRGIHWVIVGGESGHGARPMHPAWARSLRDQCQTAGVAYFFKQWGEHTPYYEAVEGGRLVVREYEKGMKRVGKHAAGRLLDGVEWNQVPQ